MLVFTDYNEKELRIALLWVWNFDTEHFAAMEQVLSLPKILHLAVERIFLKDLSGPNVGVIRKAFKDLIDTGMFQFRA